MTSQASKPTSPFPFRTLVMATLLGVTAIATSSAKHRRNLWDENIRIREQTLHQQGNPQYSRPAHQTWDDLPYPVRRYLRQAIPGLLESGDDTYHARKMIQTINFRQEGLLLMDNKTWRNFTATQTIGAADNLGFVWEAVIPLLSSSNVPSIRIYDSLVNGNAMGGFSFMGVVPFTSSDITEVAGAEAQLFLGELLRWLAEAVLIPTVFLPNAGVTWTAVSTQLQEASATFVEPVTGVSASLDFAFDGETGWITEVRCMRPYGAMPGFPLKPWVGYMSKYRRVEPFGIFVPTHMEGGWVEDDGTETLYFKGDNIELDFDLVDAPADTSSQRIE